MVVAVVTGAGTRRITGDPDHHSQRPSCGLNRTWRSALKIQFQFGRVLFALAGRRLSGYVQRSPIRSTYSAHEESLPVNSLFRIRNQYPRAFFVRDARYRRSMETR